MVQNWASFLKDSSNKAELIHLIAEKITRNRTHHKLVLARLLVVIFSSTIDIDHFSPCNHEEADTRMFLHLKDFSATGHGKVSLKTVDAEVVVIALSLFHKFDLELWTEFGTGFNLEWLPVHEYVENLRESICQAMPVWFAFTGCDTVSLSLLVARGWLGIHSNHTLLQQMHSKCKLLFHYYYYLVGVIK